MRQKLSLWILILISTIGKAQTYSDSISVNFFMIDECRISQNISGEINHVYKLFQGAPFKFQCYFPNSSSTPEKIRSFMADYHLHMDYHTDFEKTNAIKYGASIAPEVIVYDEKNQKVLYRGRIDNSYDTVSYTHLTLPTTPYV